jgi:hypothetical protein
VRYQVSHPYTTPGRIMVLHILTFTFLDNRWRRLHWFMLAMASEMLNLSSSLCVQTSSGAHPAAWTVGTGNPFRGAKDRQGRDTDHSSHLVPCSRMSRSYVSSSPKHLHGVLWNNFCAILRRIQGNKWTFESA